MRSCIRALLSGALAAIASVAAAAQTAADLVISDAKIYTQDSHHSIAQALAIRGGTIVFVGSAADAQRFVGAKTHLEKLGGRLVLPGLIDSHIHPLDIVDLDVCNLQSKALPLKELTAFVAACVAHYKTRRANGSSCTSGTTPTATSRTPITRRCARRSMPHPPACRSSCWETTGITARSTAWRSHRQRIRPAKWSACRDRPWRRSSSNIARSSGSMRTVSPTAR